MRKYSTLEVPGREKLDAWNEWICDTFV